MLAPVGGVFGQRGGGQYEGRCGQGGEVAVKRCNGLYYDDDDDDNQYISGGVQFDRCESNIKLGNYL